MHDELIYMRVSIQLENVATVAMQRNYRDHKGTNKQYLDLNNITRNYITSPNTEPR